MALLQNFTLNCFPSQFLYTLFYHTASSSLFTFALRGSTLSLFLQRQHKMVSYMSNNPAPFQSCHHKVFFYVEILQLRAKFQTTSYERDSQFKPSCGHWNL